MSNHELTTWLAKHAFKRFSYNISYIYTCEIMAMEWFGNIIAGNVLLLSNWKEYYIEETIICIGITNWILKLTIG